MPLDRLTALRALVAYELLLAPALDALEAYGWDSSEPMLVLGAQHLRGILERYLLGDLAPRDVVNWANLVECRDDIDLEESCADALGAAIFQLANPDISDPLTPDLARRLLASVAPDSSVV